eukprot:PhF_6_TR27847/c0_g1_i2/m.40657
MMQPHQTLHSQFHHLQNPTMTLQQSHQILPHQYTTQQGGMYPQLQQHQQQPIMMHPQPQPKSPPNLISQYGVRFLASCLSTVACAFVILSIVLKPWSEVKYKIPPTATSTATTTVIITVSPFDTSSLPLTKNCTGNVVSKNDITPYLDTVKFMIYAICVGSGCVVVLSCLVHLAPMVGYSVICVSIVTNCLCAAALVLFLVCNLTYGCGSFSDVTFGMSFYFLIVSFFLNVVATCCIIVEVNRLGGKQRQLPPQQTQKPFYPAPQPQQQLQRNPIAPMMHLIKQSSGVVTMARPRTVQDNLIENNESHKINQTLSRSLSPEVQHNWTFPPMGVASNKAKSFEQNEVQQPERREPVYYDVYDVKGAHQARIVYAGARPPPIDDIKIPSSSPPTRSPSNVDLDVAHDNGLLKPRTPNGATDWVWDDTYNMFWSEEEQLYYDNRTGAFYP